MAKRFKNRALWLAIAALGGMVLQDMGVPIAPDEYEMYVDGILSVLALAGVINNPDSGSGFKDTD